MSMSRIRWQERRVLRLENRFREHYARHVAFALPATPERLRAMEPAELRQARADFTAESQAWTARHVKSQRTRRADGTFVWNLRLVSREWAGDVA